MTLYLIENIKNGIYYIGVTDNLERRLKEHNFKGSHFTNRMNGEWKLIGFKVIPSEIIAKKEEQRLKKSKNKKYIKWYFENKRP